MQQPPHDVLDSSPFWQVQAVFDPDGTGKDFAYTIGLHGRGLPELHLWARPTLGEDPGLDWMLSTADRTHALNELAGMLVAGRLAVGDQVVHEYDHGLSRVTFRVDPPGDREELEAYGAPPDALVLPVRWSLSREPEGQLRPLTEDAQLRAAHAFSELVAGLDPARRGPKGWCVPTEPTFDPGQRFGPLTPLVLARAAQLWQADDRTLRELLGAGLAALCGNSLTGATSVAIALARPAGRRRCLEELQPAVFDLVELLTERPAARGRWRRVVREVEPSWWRESSGQERAAMLDNFARLLRDLTLSCLMVEAVADLADEALLLQARGPWVSGLRAERFISDPRWRAAPEVLDAVRGLLAPLDVRTLGIVAGMHEIACRRGVVEAPDYGELCARLESWALTSAVVCPWSPTLEGLPAWRALLDAAPGATLGGMPELESWATCMTSALVHRARLSADDVDTLTLLYEHDLPRLREVLNTPV